MICQYPDFLLTTTNRQYSVADNHFSVSETQLLIGILPLMSSGTSRIRKAWDAALDVLHDLISFL